MSFEEQERRIKELRDQVIRQNLEDLATIKGDGTAREQLIDEINTLSKIKLEEYKAEMDAWNDEELRRINENRNAEEALSKSRQTRAEVFRSTMDFAKGVAVAGIGCFSGFKGMQWIYKCEKDGVMPNGKALSFLPKLKIW